MILSKKKISRGSANRLKARNLKPLKKNDNLKKKKKTGFKTNPEFEPLLCVNTIFGVQNSTIHSLGSSICIDSLKQGCVDAFHEIFQLSHREPVLIDPVTEEYFSIGSNKLIDIQSKLCEAEKILRKKQFREVYDIFVELSSYLEQEKDTEQALYFLQKGKGVCLKSNKVNLCRIAYQNLGRLCGRLGDIDGCISEHEKQLQTVEKDLSSFSEEDIHSCKKDLVEAYLTKYRNLKKTTEGTRASLPLLHKSYELSKHDKPLLSRICFLLGKVFQTLEEYDESMKYLLEFRGMSDDLGDLKSSSMADKHIAKIVQKTKDFEKALESYHSFLEKSRKSGIARNIGKSCERIGNLLILKNEAGESLKYFEENYNLALQTGETKWLNSSKIRLGYARGVHRNQEFLRMIEGKNITKLLDWKDRREWRDGIKEKQEEVLDEEEEKKEEEIEGEGEREEDEEEEEEEEKNE